MITKKISGVITAVATPFKNGKIDFETLYKILVKQLEAKVDAVLLFGTTGEGISLTLNEKKKIYIFTKNSVCNIPIIAGISAPITSEAVRLAKVYESWGVDGIMLITPYYYKTSQIGVFKHFETVAMNTSLPIILYNVPARTNCDILSMNFFKKLEKHKNIVGIKQAGKTLNDCLSLLEKTSLPLFCGNDKYIYETLKAGYQGCVSVISNIFPKTIKSLYLSAKNSEIMLGKITFKKLLPVINSLELEPNPIPLKHALSVIYGCSNELRLPLITATKNTQNIINNLLNGGDDELFTN